MRKSSIAHSKRRAYSSLSTKTSGNSRSCAAARTAVLSGSLICPHQSRHVYPLPCCRSTIGNSWLARSSPSNLRASACAPQPIPHSAASRHVVSRHPRFVKGTLAQQMGRLHRLQSGKTEVRNFDYVDSGVPMLARMFEKRLQACRGFGYIRTDSAIDTAVEILDYTLEYDEEVIKSFDDIS